MGLSGISDQYEPVSYRPVPICSPSNRFLDESVESIRTRRRRRRRRRSRITINRWAINTVSDNIIVKRRVRL